MAHRAEKISTYDFKSSEALLLDANIWLFVHGPQKPTDTRVAAYSEALAKILAAKSWLFDLDFGLFSILSHLRASRGRAFSH